jgi:hypothetical protein
MRVNGKMINGMEGASTRTAQMMAWSTMAIGTTEFDKEEVHCASKMGVIIEVNFAKTKCGAKVYMWAQMEVNMMESGVQTCVKAMELPSTTTAGNIVAYKNNRILIDYVY